MISITRPSSRDMALIGVYMVVVIDIFASALSVPVMPFYVSQVCGCESMDDTDCEDAVCWGACGVSHNVGAPFTRRRRACMVCDSRCCCCAGRCRRRRLPDAVAVAPRTP